MNYIGSKLSLLSFLDESINKVTKGNYDSFCDLFTGTAVVGEFFKEKGYRIIANDIQYYSYVLARNYIGNHKSLEFKGLYEELPELKETKDEDRQKIVCDYLTNISGVKGFIYNNYCYGGTKDKVRPRQYFSNHNGMKCDAIREKIEEWKTRKLVNEDEYYFLLASLIESIDKYANTAAVYGAFLKKIKSSAAKEVKITPAEFYNNCKDHEIYNEDVNSLVKDIECDVLYLDPPYNQRQYATNYHVLETIARYDEPEVYGVTGLREYSDQKSLYCSRTKVKNVFRDLILNAKAKYIFLSYNNEGLMTHEDIKEIMGLRGKYGYFTQEYSRFKADRNDRRNHKADKTTEYLHYVVCEK